MGGSSSVRGDQTIYHTDNLCFDGTDRGSPMAVDGQLWIGSTSSNRADNGGHVRLGSLTSPNSTITIGYSAPNITLDITGGTAAVEHLTGNTGGTLNPDGANNFNILTANTTVKFAGVGATLTQDFGLGNLVLGSSLPSITSANNNVGVGNGTLNSITSGQTNVAVGVNAGHTITSAIGNTLIGQNAGLALTTGERNVAVGASALAIYSTGAANAGANIAIGADSLLDLTNGIQNTAVGDSSLKVITTGTNNIAIGYQAGQNHTAADSSNIDIGNLGTLGDSNTIRIGTQGSGAGQQLQTHIAGVINTVSGRVVKITSPGAYPYTTLTTDYVILVDTTAARTIIPLAAPVTGTTYRIKDSVGSAAANNITITPSGKNIDGAASYVIDKAYGAVDIVYNGTEWSKF